jgi:hypothetical protein
MTILFIIPQLKVEKEIIWVLQKLTELPCSNKIEKGANGDLLSGCGIGQMDKI